MSLACFLRFSRLGMGALRLTLRRWALPLRPKTDAPYMQRRQHGGDSRPLSTERSNTERSIQSAQYERPRRRDVPDDASHRREDAATRMGTPCLLSRPGKQQQITVDVAHDEVSRAPGLALD